MCGFWCLVPEPFVVLLRARHPIVRKKKLSLDDYLSLRHVLVAPRGLPGSLVDTALEKRRRTRVIAARVQHFVSAAIVVARSDLAVTCPAVVFRAVNPELKLLALEPPVELGADRNSVVWHERAQVDSGHVWLRERLSVLLDDPS